MTLIGASRNTTTALIREHSDKTSCCLILANQRREPCRTSARRSAPETNAKNPTAVRCIDSRKGNSSVTHAGFFFVVVVVLCARFDSSERCFPLLVRPLPESYRFSSYPGGPLAPMSRTVYIFVFAEHSSGRTRWKDEAAALLFFKDSFC